MGYGFLIFESKEAAEKALSDLKGKFMPKTNNKFFKLNYASFNDKNYDNKHSAYVCNLSPIVTSEQLASFFKSKYNSVSGAKVVIDPSTKLSKGYGFVIFSDAKEKDKAIVEMNGVVFKDKPIKTGNAWHKKFFNNRSKSNHSKHYNRLFLQQLYQNPYLAANNYYAQFFNPLFQQQFYSQLEEYLNCATDDGNNIN